MLIFSRSGGIWIVPDLALALLQTKSARRKIPVFIEDVEA
jgi:hypothetical protein